jgi:uncharacterized protein YjiS (DUF1127 family)
MYTDTYIAPETLSIKITDRIVSYLAALRDHHLERREVFRLREMDEHRLRDIGVTGSEARHAQPRPFRDFVR